MIYRQWKVEIRHLAEQHGLMWLLGDDEISYEEMYDSGMTPKEVIQSLYEDAGCPIEDAPN